VAGFKPPIGVANNARKAIEWREKYPKETADAGTQVGWTRARQLANRENISEDTIGRMVSFFARHKDSPKIPEELRNEPWRDNGYLMHLAWGGDEGKTWCNKIYNQIQNNKSFNSSMSQIEHKHIQLEAKSLNEIKGTITLKACYYGNVDRVNDILEKNACNYSINKFANAKKNSSWDGNKIPFLLEHNGSEILAINIDDLYDTDEAPVVVATISEDFKKLQPAKVQDIYEKIKEGKMFASIGYRPVKSYVDNNKIRRLQEIKLVEISLTTNPANMKATMIDLKSINLPKYPVDIESSWDGTQAEQRWREYTKSIEMPNTNYKNGFLYFDAEKQENFGSYHLQVVDVVDGEPKINERAVFAVYQAMRGARGGLTVVPESEMPRLEGAVNELYKKINRVRVAEGMEELEMPNFKTKSEFDIALDNIKNKDIPFAKTNFERMLVKMKKDGKIILSHKEISKLVDAVYKGKMQTQEIEKILDIENNDVNEKSEPHSSEAHSMENLIDEVKTQTNSIPTLEEELENLFKI
jgi:phage head maturation protease